MTEHERYSLGRRLGGGGMAEVFAASTQGAEGFARRVAIKRVLPGLSNDPEFARMFVAEAQLTSRLAHPNIVSVLDFDRDSTGRLFLVMEFLDGPDLHTLCAQGTLPFEVVTYIAAEVLRGLGYAHDLPLGEDVQGLIHRDVSPHNVMLSLKGEVKVSDFGLAKVRDGSAASATHSLKGKPAYMSPEQANGEPLDARSDLFAVGVMLWEMLVGRRLFQADDLRASIAAVLFGEVPRPRQLRPEIPRDLERVVMTLLERDLGQRYQSASEAIADLSKCTSVSPSAAGALAAILNARGGEVPRPQASVVPVATDGRVRVRRPRSRQRARTVYLIGSVTGVVAIALLVVIASRRSSDTSALPDRTNAATSRGQVQPPAANPLAIDWTAVPPACVPYLREIESLTHCRALSIVSRQSYARSLQALSDTYVAHRDDYGTVFPMPDKSCDEGLAAILAMKLDC